jgi:hypothetical protein
MLYNILGYEVTPYILPKSFRASLRHAASETMCHERRDVSREHTCLHTFSPLNYQHRNTPLLTTQPQCLALHPRAFRRRNVHHVGDNLPRATTPAHIAESTEPTSGDEPRALGCE